MNKESYAALTPTQKAAFDKLTGKALALRAAKIFDDWARGGVQAGDARANGSRSSSLPPEVRKRCSTPPSPSVEKIIAEFEKGGIPDAGRSIRR